MEKEIQEWKSLLDKGLIDKETYQKNVTLILKHNGNIPQRTWEKSKIHEMKKVLKKIIIGLFCLLIVLILLSNIVKKEYVEISSFDNIPAPIQKYTTGQEFIKVYGKTIKLMYVAEYTINGRVVEKHDYIPLTVANQIAPIDLGLAWGQTAINALSNKVSWSNFGNRFLYCSYDKDVKINNSEWSNNHLVPKNSKITALLNKIKIGDYIEITGYLVEYSFRDYTGTKCIQTTSKSRTDSGDGACEVIYVTGVKWLKEIKEGEEGYK